MFICLFIFVAMAMVTAAVRNSRERTRYGNLTHEARLKKLKHEERLEKQIEGDDRLLE